MIDGDAVTHELVLPAPAEQVFGMFTDPRQLIRLRLVHAGLAGDLGLLHDDGWYRFLARLAAVTGGGEPAACPGEQPTGRLTALRGQHDGTASS